VKNSSHNKILSLSAISRKVCFIKELLIRYETLFSLHFFEAPSFFGLLEQMNFGMGHIIVHDSCGNPIRGTRDP